MDLEGNQAVDTLFYNATEPHEHYSAQDTIRAQGNIYLTTGSVLRSNRGRAMLEIVDDTCGRHDTLGGACSAESNTVRYALEKRHMHSCGTASCSRSRAATRVSASATCPRNVNFFMNVPVTPAGTLSFADGISAPGRHVELLALIDVRVLISNCPQLNNPCNGWDPTPVRVITRSASA